MSQLPSLANNQAQTISSMKEIITTPYIKIISILNDVKKYIASTNRPQQKLVADIEWAIRVIKNHSLYSYEFSDKEKIEKLKSESKNFRQFADYVDKYNKEIIEMNKKNDIVLSSAAHVSSNLGLFQIPSIKIKRAIPNQNSFNLQQNKKFIPSYNKIGYLTNKNSQKDYDNSNQLMKLELGYRKGSLNDTFKHSLDFSVEKKEKQKDRSNLVTDVYIGFSPTKSQNQNLFSFNNKNVSNKTTKLIKRFHTPNKETTQISFIFAETSLAKANYDVRNILTKDFDMFELRNIIGQDNVLPIMGKTILENFGLNDSKIDSTKLESFLVTVSTSYFHSTLYHNSMHGSDVTHTVTMIFLNSNAEEVCATNVLDIMSIIIASLGHDIGHPGLTNNFHVNAQSELALTYNDASCLENFHASKLFSVAKSPANNIFEKLSVPEFKTLRKRMISMILATDMFYHGKVMSIIKSKINFIEEEEQPKSTEQSNNQGKNPNDVFLNRKVAELISKEDTKFDNQQAFLDYFIHAADLAHNTKLFRLSIQWVELLSNEFWLQGDKEKEMNLPVSFLCDRNSTDVPKSQVSFIGGVIIPTFEVLIQIFPSLTYMVDNAKTNLDTWQKISDEGRKRGWTPPKKQDQQHENSQKSTLNPESRVSSSIKQQKENSKSVSPKKSSGAKPKYVISNKGHNNH